MLYERVFNKKEYKLFKSYKTYNIKKFISLINKQSITLFNKENYNFFNNIIRDLYLESLSENKDKKKLNFLYDVFKISICYLEDKKINQDIDLLDTLYSIDKELNKNSLLYFLCRKREFIKKNENIYYIFILKNIENIIKDKKLFLSLIKNYDEYLYDMHEKSIIEIIDYMMKNKYKDEEIYSFLINSKKFKKIYKIEGLVKVLLDNNYYNLIKRINTENIELLTNEDKNHNIIKIINEKSILDKKIKSTENINVVKKRI